MNKIIPILLIFVLCSCTTEQVKTSDISNPTSVTTAPSRHRSILNIGSSDTQNTPDEENLLPRIVRYLKQGVASWYGPEFHGKKTASGEIYDMYAMTAAHKTLPISSYARVTNLENQRSVIVRINDRGPFHGDRVMDLSYAAAQKLDLEESGTGAVEIKAIPPEQALAQLQRVAKEQDKSVYLQVGTFGNKKTAQNLQNKIASNNLPHPKILPSKHKGSTLYKVQMGPIKSPESVHKLNIQLAKLGITATQFVTGADQKQISMIQ
ncbi:septal ring lytic transglycosylase RlpA family protein [Candidatus Methylobacter oryzae]|uniref:Endolytic peptidoglycan transglycosylase RlpA n=1 Tax=Candidatus Methylobacter oryzae TaxID=2497749 RepID=A0ABY3CE35_9GAMM|nr:septal ring lytic transglycosylase RlpA family protein [Candidatus Methylobacter oryzae]TRX00771.1 septal ring lytic transglycosylase RlpA family protein [Candidatus Methylobacter oryzae]